MSAQLLGFSLKSQERKGTMVPWWQLNYSSQRGDSNSGRPDFKS